MKQPNHILQAYRPSLRVRFRHWLIRLAVGKTPVCCNITVRAIEPNAPYGWGVFTVGGLYLNVGIQTPVEFHPWPPAPVVVVPVSHGPPASLAEDTFQRPSKLN